MWFCWKRRSYGLFNMTAYRFFSIQKCFGYYTSLITSLKQRSWIMIRCQNSIVTANVPGVHCQLQATPASSRLIWEILYSLVNRFLWQVAPDNLKRFLEFGACFRICFKLAVNLQHCTLYMIVRWVYIRRIWRTLAFCDLDSWPTASSVRSAALRSVCADTPFNWKMNPVGSRRLL